MREASSLVRPMSNLTISYWARYSMILSKIADRWPESIRCPSASIVSLAAMAAILAVRFLLKVNKEPAGIRIGDPGSAARRTEGVRYVTTRGGEAWGSCAAGGRAR